jgi:hypothetical protein
MQSTPTFFGVSTIPLVPIIGRPKPKPADLVAIVRSELDKTVDPARQNFLIGVASDLLKRRQSHPAQPRRRWR